MILTDLDSSFVIKWRLTNMCNFSCPYCIQKYQKYSQPYDPQQLVKEQTLLERTASVLDSKLTRETKLELIGGEPTLFDLQSILSHFNNLARIQITTNLARPLSYFISLIDYCHKCNIFISLTCSKHPQCTDYYDKVLMLKKKADIVTCEIVSRVENQEEVKEFQQWCEDNDCYYMIEQDLSWCYTGSPKPNLLFGAKKPDGRPRYIDDTGREYKTRNEFLSEQPDGVLEGLKMCSCHKDSVYVKQDKVKYCDTDWIPIEEWVWKDEWVECDKRCTLCGHQSIIMK